MKIAMVSYECPPDTAFGGIATYVRQAARVLVDRNHHVEIFAASGQRSGRTEEGGITINLVPELDRVKFAEVVCAIFTARHREVAFDVVESPDFSADGREILRIHPRIPHVVKLHTPTELVHRMEVCPPKSRGWVGSQLRRARRFCGSIRRSLRLARRYVPQTPIMYELERNNARNCHLVVSPSDALAQWAIREWKLDAARVMTVPNPYVPSAKMMALAVGGAEKVVGFFGRLQQLKGVSDLIEAIPLIMKAMPDARFRFVGESLWRPGTSERFDDYLLRRLERFRYAIDVLGQRPLDEMPAHYQAVGVCVFPSHWDNFPNVCLEAMAAGRAIVASTAGGMAEMLEHGKNGLLVAPRNPKSIAEAVIRLLRAPKLQETFGTSARRRVLEAYSAERIGPKLEESYEVAIALCGMALQSRP